MKPPTATELQEVSAAVLRTAMARGFSRDAAEDVAQETLSRLLAASERLSPDARLPFALTTASNLITDTYRRDQRHRRHEHRLYVRDTSGPEADYLEAEQAAAVRSALDGLSPGERRLLLDHEAGSSTDELARASQSTPGAVAARLARTRARLRLDYLLALRRASLPTASCRRVLLAISAADLRRQRALDTAGHLANCQTCADLVPPLAQRRSQLAGIAIAPLIGLGALGGHLHRLAKNRAVQASAATAAIATGTVIGVLAVHPRPAATPDARPVTPVSGSAITSAAPTPAPSPVPSPALTAVQTASGNALLPLPPTGSLRNFSGQRVVVSNMPVQFIASHPGFWIGTGSQRIYVHIADPAHIRVPVRVGYHVSFTALLTANPPGFADRDGVTLDEGAAVLTKAGAHLVVQAADLLLTDGTRTRPAG